MKEELLDKIRNEIKREYVINDKVNIDDVMYDVFERNSLMIEDNDTNKIYVYRGTYRNVKAYDDYQNSIVTRNSPLAEYSIYSDLEKYNLLFVNISDREKFEKENMVIFDENYYIVRREFALTAIKEGQEEAVNKVLKKVKKNEKV